MKQIWNEKCPILREKNEQKIKYKGIHKAPFVKRQNYIDDSELECDYNSETRTNKFKGEKVLNITQKIPHLKDFFNDN